MNVISRRMIRTFYKAKPARRLHGESFENWFKIARKARWTHFEQCKATFGQTDVTKTRSGKTATIFDIGGNEYRIICNIDYVRQTVKIEAVMDHEEYGKKKWLGLF